MKVYVVSLGCPKNLTDTEVLLGKLVAAGYQITANPAQAEMIIVNTCAFLQSARDEANAVIKEMLRWKKKGKCKKLYVAGCLPKWRGSKGWSKGIDGVIDSIGAFDCNTPRIKATPPWYAYVKIAEGCNNCCSYCLIPAIRGKLKVRTVSDVISEVKLLAKRNVKEIIFVAQDTTAYPNLPSLLKKTARIRGIRWIRLMYAHPAHLSDELIEVIAKEKKILKYLDLPIQHASDKILKMMDRPYGQHKLEKIISKLRAMIPAITVRSSVIVGFPGETKADFEVLKAFLARVKFDRLGVFAYFREKGTAAYKLYGQVNAKTKAQRFQLLMRQQQKISKEENHAFIGKKISVLVEGKNKNGYFGRTYRDAPDIDGQIFFSAARRLKIGSFVKVRITQAKAYDLLGKAAD